MDLTREECTSWEVRLWFGSKDDAHTTIHFRTPVALSQAKWLHHFTSTIDFKYIAKLRRSKLVVDEDGALDVRFVHLEGIPYHPSFLLNRGTILFDKVLPPQAVSHVDVIIPLKK